MTTANVMSSSELRASFIEFFTARGHKALPSASLVPAELSTTLFTIAGMEPFVPIFLGETPAPAKRVVTVQRCLRVAGAKSDIENVGRTGRHGTFLEMLGNFAFADYGKRQAIMWAWEYVTECLHLDANRLYVTVHTADDEAQTIWQTDIGIPAERISRFDEDNFWTMGPTGPCGPSTEIFYDTGVDYAAGPHDTGPNLGNRFVEIWNVVFQQYNREADGSLRELAALNIDTGAGLERILAIVNGHRSMYETDLFTDLIAAQPPIGITTLSKDEQLVRQRIIADHARAVTTLIADGVFPSNTDRGYVLRFLIRRAIRNGRLLGYPAGFLTRLVPAVVHSLAEGMPELVSARERIGGVLGREEEAFERTLERGEAMLERRVAALREAKTTELHGSDAFILHDTFGFPYELTREIVAEHGLGIDHAGFEREMNEQRRRARSDAAAKRGVVSVGGNAKVSHTSSFHGYEGLESEGRILEILTESGTPVNEAIAGERIRCIVDHTSFYAERGGQIGDHGVILSDTARLVVDDTQPLADAIVHYGYVESGVFRRDETVRTLVDQAWRTEIRRHHTSVHLLQYALRSVLGEEIRQAGSWVGPERMRFDFHSPFGALTAQQRHEITALINRIIRDDSPIETRELPLEEARATGAIFMEADAYGNKVRVLQAGPSLEFCGGTHAHRTGELGHFLLLSESSIGSGIRRIEGVVSMAAERYIEQQQELVHALSAAFVVKPEELLERAQRLQLELRQREREVSELRLQRAVDASRRFIDEAELINGIRTVAVLLEDIDGEGVKHLAAALRSRLYEDHIVVVAAVNVEQVTLFLVASDGAVKRGIHAGNLLKAALPHIEGKGGGGAAQAQGGGRRRDGAAAALRAIRSGIAK